MMPTAPTGRSQLHRPATWLARTTALGLLVCAGLAALPGCYSEGGTGYSNDQHCYVSTTWQPKTITLKDTRTGQSFWSIDVPVGKKLVVQFRENANGPDAKPGDATPDMMLWDLVDVDDDFAPLANQIPVPARAARRLDMTLRASPELPESMGSTASKAPPKTGAGAMKK